MRAPSAILSAMLVVGLLGCGESPTGGNNSGPWIGSWVQVNFLATDDGGVWDQDDLSGIGFVAEVTASEWIETDDFGAGCSVTSSYSVDGSNDFSRQAIRLSSGCPSLPLGLLATSGRFEFSGGNDVMIEWFDLQAGDDIEAFKWVRR